MISKIKDKILFKIYMQHVLFFIIRRLNLDFKNNLLNNYLVELNVINKNSSEILALTSNYFSNNFFKRFNNICNVLVRQILLEPKKNRISFNMDDISFQDLLLLNKIADSFGRFDLGYQLRLQYCHKIENKILNGHSSRRDVITYLFNKQTFGDDLFNHKQLNVKLKVPFFLKRLHKKLDFSYHQQLAKKTDYFNKIHDKKVALLAPGILEFTPELIDDLSKFDEIIPLTYTVEHYQDLNFPIKISYYNGENSNRLLNDKDFIESSNLDYYCSKDFYSDNGSIRTIFRDSSRWLIGSPNFVQCALYDLLVHSPNQIKVYGANFFLSTNPYNSKYKTNLSLYSLASHNMISNYLYINNLFKKGLIELDDAAQNIIGNGVAWYTTEMTKLYKLEL